MSELTHVSSVFNTQVSLTLKVGTIILFHPVSLYHVYSVATDSDLFEAIWCFHWHIQTQNCMFMFWFCFFRFQWRLSGDALWIFSYTFPQNTAWQVWCIITLGFLLEFKITLCVCEQCLAVEFALVDPDRSVEFKRSARTNNILSVFLEGLDAGDHSATVTVEGSILTTYIYNISASKCIYMLHLPASYSNIYNCSIGFGQSTMYFVLLTSFAELLLMYASESILSP